MRLINNQASTSGLTITNIVKRDCEQEPFKRDPGFSIVRTRMALLCQMLCICALYVPSFVEGGRPFHIPKTLFSPALENAHLPRFAREIRAAENEMFQQNEDANSEEDEFTHYKRKRRDVPSNPTTSYVSHFNILKHEFFKILMYLEEINVFCFIRFGDVPCLCFGVPSNASLKYLIIRKPHDLYKLFCFPLKTNLNVSSRTLYMYWTPSSVLKNNILLLVKTSKGNSVYKSTDFGRNWKNINNMLKINATTFALIDHIYITQADPHFVS